MPSLAASCAAGPVPVASWLAEPLPAPDTALPDEPLDELLPEELLDELLDELLGELAALADVPELPNVPLAAADDCVVATPPPQAASDRKTRAIAAGRSVAEQHVGMGANRRFCKTPTYRDILLTGQNVAARRLVSNTNVAVRRLCRCAG
jgi:hypothetical protein